VAWTCRAIREQVLGMEFWCSSVCVRCAFFSSAEVQKGLKIRTKVIRNVDGGVGTIRLIIEALSRSDKFYITLTPPPLLEALEGI
jgi:hypothetical protein